MEIAECWFIIVRMSLRHSQNNTNYWVYKDDTKLPVIIMIHGFRGTHHGLDLIAKQLDEYQVIVPDLPGFGESKPFDGTHSLENYVKWLSKFIVDLKLLTPPILLGHSFGSIIASRYASENPQTISQLILVNPIGAPATKGPKKLMTQLALIYYWLGIKLPESLAKRLLSLKSVIMIMSITMAKTKDKTLRKFIHNQHLTHFNSFSSRKSVTEAFKTSVQHNVSDVAGKITNQTLLIAGDRDDITPVSKQRQLAKVFPNAKLRIIKNVGHLTHYEKPTEVVDAIKKFLH